MRLKIDWNLTEKDNARYSVRDSETTCYVAEEQMILIPGQDGIASMKAVAMTYAANYDHSGTEGEYAVCVITDELDGEEHDFAFDGRGNFEWDTNR